MGIKKRIRAYKAPNLSNKLKKRSGKSRKLNLMKDPKSTNLWDKFQTLKRNYKKIDIALDLNNQNHILDNAQIQEEDEKLAQFTDIRLLKEKMLQQGAPKPSNELQGAIITQGMIEASKPTKRKAAINRDEAMAVKILQKKYNENFGSWARDIKLNIF